MQAPFLSGAAFLDDVAHARADRERLHLWWLGQSGFLAAWNGFALLIDPYLSDALTTKYATTDKPHVRMTGLVVNPGELAGIDAATSSHNHTDHLDAETLRPILHRNPSLRIVVPAANVAFAGKRLGLDPSRLDSLDAGQDLALGPLNIHAVPAAHEAIDRDALGRCCYLGYVFRLGPWTIYHSGDTMRYEGMVDLLRPFRPDVALLPINGRGQERRVAGNLWGPEAAQLAKDIGAALVIPCHYDMFEFNTASPADFESAACNLDQPYRVLHHGERWSVGSNQAFR
ncbi:MAG: MBL fold metallo-hydrolase [Verrucomicrobia bacterium]|nr:MBL fold metallo-hydrolase [Verrucomicrobiota bacterium]